MHKAKQGHHLSRVRLQGKCGAARTYTAMQWIYSASAAGYLLCAPRALWYWRALRTSRLGNATLLCARADRANRSFPNDLADQSLVARRVLINERVDRKV